MVLASCLLPAASLHAQLVACSGTPDASSIGRALAAIERSVDPCGESGELRALLAALRRCTRATYEICTDRTTRRNVFDRPAAPRQGTTRTITWNPGLTSELEVGCDDDPGRPVPRDPTASLVHELAHAAQDCQGLNPGEHELEAVRIENIYRRGAGLCQRRGYGDQLLPAAMVKVCTATACPCASPTELAGGPGRIAPDDPPGRDESTASGDLGAPSAP
jgi:hypothetical protein